MVNFYKHYIGDYQRDTGHLSLTEHGAYRLMLDTYYATKKPLPSDRKTLYRLLRAETPTERKAIDSIARQFWAVSDDGLINERAETEIGKAEKQAEVNRQIALTREEKKRQRQADEKKAFKVSYNEGSGNFSDKDDSNEHDSEQSAEQKNIVYPDHNLPQVYKVYDMGNVEKVQEKTRTIRETSHKTTMDTSDRAIGDTFGLTVDEPNHNHNHNQNQNQNQNHSQNQNSKNSGNDEVSKKRGQVSVGRDAKKTGEGAERGGWRREEAGTTKSGNGFNASKAGDKKAMQKTGHALVSDRKGGAEAGRKEGSKGGHDVRRVSVHSVLSGEVEQNGLYSSLDLTKEMRSAGIEAQAADPRIMALAVQGISPMTIRAACEEAKRCRPNERIGPAYVVKIVERWAKDAAQLQVRGARPQAALPCGGVFDERKRVLEGLTGRSGAPKEAESLFVDARTIEGEVLLASEE